ncbi:apolipoprotein N-acyltransferase [Marinobacter zhejiangensis]|uniref:Apolipoprotein N-acyltransferase n=1 Tax=Marinobacter zhejiangensis TaxID=488535 RepID=A0A1I4QK49_9GAMM|nr:apolipoprotein N-acyltransferase [Marinobacter zhejiangensis]SFM40449.1 Apolipoprotein N-acyltransferase [Marinobacter zhejiangensis]
MAPDSPLLKNRWLANITLLAAGALQTLTFSPYEWWWLGPISIALILACTVSLPSEKLFRAGWLAGLGLFGSGASWVYISISHYGNTSVPLSILLTAVFVAGLSLFHGLAFWGWGKLAKDSKLRRLLLFPAIWILGDWLRGWLLTGFPWLYLGTAQVDGPLAGWAPLLGVHGVTLWVIALGMALYASAGLLRLKRPGPAAAALTAGLLPWLLGPALNSVAWTQLSAAPISVATMQGNVPQLIKWDPNHLKQQIVTYLGLTNQDWQQDLILWPETAIPLTQDQAGAIFEHIETNLGPNSTLITGIPWYGFSDRIEDFTFHNSIMALGNGEGMYHKQKLVPFGEYVPLQQWLRGLIGFFDLPMSEFSRGPAHQSPLIANNLRIMPYICYEVAYPDFVAINARTTDLLVTISNDGWFGDSIGPLQHLQIARMRALETGRYMVRGTNNGLTAIIDQKGQIATSIPQFTEATLRGEAYTARGNTPYMETGSWPVLTFAAILIVFVREREIPKTNQGPA